MDNTNTNTKFNSKLHEANDRFSDVKHQITDKVDDVTEMASDFYNKASHWLDERNAKGLGLVALVAAVGVFGFILGRNTGGEISDMASKAASTAKRKLSS